MKLSVITAMGIWLMTFNLAAHAASFDCNKATLKTEKRICVYRGLNDSDVKMATTFNILTHALPMGGRDHLKDEQRAWLQQRNQCGSNIGCIVNAYQNRQQQLDQMLQERVLSHGPF